MNLTGTIYKISDTQEVSEKFKKREFVLEHVANPTYPQYVDFIKLELTQDRCSHLDSYNEGDEVEVEFNIRGNKYNDRNTGEEKFFNSLLAWSLKLIKKGDAPPVQQVPSSQPKAAQPAKSSQATDVEDSGNATVVAPGEQSGDVENDMLPF